MAKYILSDPNFSDGTHSAGDLAIIGGLRA
jgi:hypothetical protein